MSTVGLEPKISCVRDRDDTTRPQTQRQHSRSLYWTQFMLQWFLRFPEFAEFTEFNESSAPFRENSIVKQEILFATWAREVEPSKAEPKIKLSFL